MNCYGSVRVPCACCQIESSFRLDHKRLCPKCEMHQGSTGMRIQKRDTDHVQMWKTYHVAETVRHRATAQRDEQIAAQSQQRITELTEKLSDAEHVLRTGHATDAVANWLESVQVQEAEAKADRAYRSRDRVAAALWEVNEVHNDDDHDGTCACGKRLSACKESAIIGPLTEFLNNWERRQVERARQGLPHHLPDSHPSASGRSTMRRWEEGA
jgi:hypothetical protein